MKKLLLFFSAVCCLWTTNPMNAQLVDVINEVVATSVVPIGDLPAGYTTYRIYARLEDPTDRISAVFGSTTPSPIHHLRIHSSNAGSAIYNSSFSGSLGTDNNCGFWGFVPSMPFDSYVTFRAVDTPTDPCPQCSPTGTIFNISNPPNEIPGTFAVSPLGPDLTMEDGAWFIPNDGSCYGFPSGVDNRILIAQVTVPTGTLEYWLNIAIFDEALGTNQMIYVHTQQAPPGLVGTISEIDGNCLGLVFPEPAACAGVPGCTNPVACNFDPLATIDDGSCLYPAPQPGFCDAALYPNNNLLDPCAASVCAVDPFCCNTAWDSICASEAAADPNCAYCLTPLGTLGCTDINACNYNPAACADDGSCILPDGCNDPAACNYDAAALCDDGSCLYTSGGCNEVGYADLSGPCATSVCSYDSFCCTNAWDSICANEAATDANCAYCLNAILGCTDPTACNYNAAAQCDDGSCIAAAPTADCDVAGYSDLGGPCAASVCALDSFCCDVSWDGICAISAAANANCAYCLSSAVNNGCTDPTACNYDAYAECEDGSCTYPDGCNDPNACNFDPAATCDDGSCAYEACDVLGYSDLTGPCAASVCAGDSFCCDVSWDSICAMSAASDLNCAYCVGGTAVVGCTDPSACNFNAAATCDDGSCIASAATPDCDVAGYSDLGGPCAVSVCAGDSFCCDVSWDSICATAASTNPACAYCLSSDVSSGCTDATACNYDAYAECEDGSCTYPGCIDPIACNFDPFAGCDGGGCILPDGCDDPTACNYDPTALCNDGSCDYGVLVNACDQAGYSDLAGPCAASVCAGDSFCCDVAWDSICATSAASDPNCAYCLGGQDGCTDPTACNYNAAAQCDDGSCILPDGCTDVTACNYDPTALCDDGSCIL
ncbi:MAG: hypothetical protein SH856_13840, partial [Flavobacteriales bacterium]|nr:hypothetical protein [Flavobacteriales bacterium]